MNINNTLLNLINEEAITNIPEMNENVKPEEIKINKPNIITIGVHDINSLKYYNPSGEQSKDVPDITIKYYFIFNNDPFYNVSNKTIKLKQLSPGHRIEFDLSDLPSDGHTLTIIIQSEKKEEKLFVYFDGVVDSTLHKLYEDVKPNNAYYFADIKKDENGIWSIIEIINYGEH